MLRCLVSVLLAGAACGEVSLPRLLSDHMVLQSGRPVRIWGWADPGEAVTVEFQGQHSAAVTSANGRWELHLKPLKAGASGEMTVRGRNTIVLQDVLVGEVWVASGQSNMQLKLSQAKDSKQTAAAAKFPLIRFFRVKFHLAMYPQEDVGGEWTICSPESAPQFSAVAYYYARDLHQHKNVPVGILEAAWGGTKAQAWTSRETLADDPALRFVFDDYAKTLDTFSEAKAKYDSQYERWKTESELARRTGKPEPSPLYFGGAPGSQNNLSQLYNGMIQPLTPYAIRGAIWYQGESNSDRAGAYPYRWLFRSMITDWRRAWGQGDFPFLFVQLPNYSGRNWPILRESQMHALALRNTAMTVAIDVGDLKDIHPTDKEPVGQRLALAARAVAYKEPVEYSGPLFRTFSIEGKNVRLFFDHAASGVMARGGGNLAGFVVAGADRKFVAADAAVEGDTVVVSAGGIDEPAAVRYAWEPNPVCNLVGKSGLPASPFRTDNWEPREKVSAPLTKTLIIVAADGSGDFRSVQDAVDAVPPGNAARIVLQIKPGTYRGRVWVPKDKLLTFRGEAGGTTLLTFFQAADASQGERSSGSSTVVLADGFEAENITFENTYGIGAQALAMYISGDKGVFRNCRFLGGQGTLFASSGRQYFKNCYIEGWVDFIYSNGTAVFEKCEIHSKGAGYLTAQTRKNSKDSNGFVFIDCRLTAEPGLERKVYLGRPSAKAARVVFLNCEMASHILPEGWHNGDKPEREQAAFYAEYRTSGAGANAKARVAWSRQLSVEEARQFSSAEFLKGADGWNPAQEK